MPTNKHLSHERKPVPKNVHKKDKGQKHKQAVEKSWKKEHAGKENIPSEAVVKMDLKANPPPMPLATRPVNAATRKVQQRSLPKANKEPVLTKAERRRIAHEARRAARSVHSDCTMRLSRASAYRIRQLEDMTPLYAEKLDFSSPKVIVDRRKSKRQKRDSDSGDMV